MPSWDRNVADRNLSRAQVTAYVTQYAGQLDVAAVSTIGRQLVGRFISLLAARMNTTV